jgi:hypothetical protein
MSKLIRTTQNLTFTAGLMVLEHLIYKLQINTEQSQPFQSRSRRISF